MASRSATRRALAFVAFATAAALWSPAAAAASRPVVLDPPKVQWTISTDGTGSVDIAVRVRGARTVRAVIGGRSTPLARDRSSGRFAWAGATEDTRVLEVARRALYGIVIRACNRAGCRRERYTMGQVASPG